MTRVRDIRKKAIDQLGQAASDSARLDVDLLLAAALGLGTLDIILEPDRIMTGDARDIFQKLLTRRMAREPMSYILGKKDFWNHSFKVSQDCLTPRPDSETLIVAALDFIPDRNAPLHILDLGTGSGCLLLSLLFELPHSSGVGVDISEKALACARENADRLGFLARCDFLVSDWTSALPPSRGFDIILCNPPYIARAEMPDLAPDVRDYEPHVALFAGDNGLADYKRLAEIIPEYVNAGTGVFLEIGHTQGPDVRRIFSQTKGKDIRIIPDLAGRDRCLALKY